MTTARFQRNGQEPKYIPDAINYKGYLAGETTKGVGKSYEVYTHEGDCCEEFEEYEKFLRPYFDSSKKDAGILRTNGVAQMDIREIVGTEWESYLLKWGENNEYSIVDYDEFKKKEREIQLQKEKAGIDYGDYIMKYDKTTYFQDEDGKSPCHHYTVIHKESKKQFTFTDRNVFDAGRCLNPSYEIDPEWGIGGLVSYDDAEQVWLSVKPCDITGAVTAKDTLGNSIYAQTNKHYRDYVINEKGEYCFIFKDYSKPIWTSCSKKDGKFIGWKKVRNIDEIEMGAIKIAQKHGRAYNGIRL